MKKFLATVLAFVAVVSLCSANSFRELLNEEKAAFGATHVSVVKASDFTSTATNTSTVLTNGLVAVGTGVECKGVYLVKPFDTAADSGAFTNTSFVLKAGRAGDDDMYVTSAELAENGTEALFTYATSSQMVFTASTTNLLLTFTPNAHVPQDTNAVGEVHVFWNLRRYTDAKKE